MRVRLSVTTGYLGARHEEIVDVDDSTSDEDLDEMAEQLMRNHVESFWEKL